MMDPDELEYAALLFRTIFWLVATIGAGAAFIQYWWA